MRTNVNVSVLVPNLTVKSMQDELADGSVEKAVQAALAAYREVDSDGTVPVLEYDEDFDNAVETAVKHADTTEGVDVLVIVTDLECNDPAKAERLLKDTSDMVVIVPVSNQGYNEDWAAKLDADHEDPNNVDVVEVADLANRDVALAEVGPFLGRVAS